MRLGAYDCVLAEGSHAAKAYGATRISERHRHRFEFNDAYRQRIEDAGMKCVGRIPTLIWSKSWRYPITAGS